MHAREPKQECSSAEESNTSADSWTKIKKNQEERQILITFQFVPGLGFKVNQSEGSWANVFWD